jgi:gluconolactonase
MMRIISVVVILLVSAYAFLFTGCASKNLYPESADLMKLAGGFAFTEGPTADAEGNVYFTDQPNDRIMIWSTDGKLATFMQPCGRSNGLYFDHSNNLIACADEKNELWSISPQKEVNVLVKDYEGKLLNGPNDAWVRDDGGIYFTDPFYKREYWKRGPIEQSCQGVYFLFANRQRLIRVVDDLKQPNGIVGTPDGRTLFIADIGAGKTYRYAIQADGSLSGKTLFCNMGSDGMTLDERGNLYLTGQGVTAFNPKGEKIAHFDVPEGWTANVCFGGKDGKTLFITASQGIYGLRMNVRGVGSFR